MDSDPDLLGKIPELRAQNLPELIPDLIDRWMKTGSVELRDSLFQFFIDSKNEEELDYYLEAIADDKNLDHRAELMSILWQSSLDSSSHIEFLVEIALKSDYMTIVETGSIIESYTAEFDEQELTELVYRIDDEIDSEEADEDRIKLLINLKQIIQELPLI